VANPPPPPPPTPPHTHTHTPEPIHTRNDSRKRKKGFRKAYPGFEPAGAFCPEVEASPEARSAALPVGDSFGPAATAGALFAVVAALSPLAGSAGDDEPPLVVGGICEDEVLGEASLALPPLAEASLREASLGPGLPARREANGGVRRILRCDVDGVPTISLLASNLEGQLNSCKVFWTRASPKFRPLPQIVSNKFTLPFYPMW
jgi:hypothetical protein